MTTNLRIVPVLLFGTLISCQPSVDLDAERAALLQADQEWAAAATEGSDVDRIVSFWSDDAKVYPPGAPVVDGKQAIREFVATSMEVPGFSVGWEPVQVVVAPSGDLGYTICRNHFTVPDANGNLVTTHGRGITVWRKAADGTWKCVIDIWNNEPAAEEGAE